jgi:nucleotide-binding universal stress UspA family protein
MKTILVPTDFSISAENAAHYAIQLAKVLKTDVKLCNAFLAPIETDLGDTVVWPLEDYNSIKDSVNRKLYFASDRLTKQEKLDPKNVAYPHIDFASSAGNVLDVVREIVNSEDVPLVVMGMSGAGALSRLFLGSNSRDMIEAADFPLLLIPQETDYKIIRKIALATDLNEHDLEIIYSLAAFARNLNAEILIAHITGEKYDDPEHQKMTDNFLSDVTCKANYDKIYYRHVKSMDVPHGLNWICEHSLSDMIVMSHGKHNIIDAFFGGSYTQKLARHVNIPLMVYPKHVKSSALIVF